MSQNESTTQNSSEENLLTGISVIELGDEISAAYCTKMMAYLGADVLKIEKPSIGDSARSVGPFPDDVADIEKSALFLYLNTCLLYTSPSPRDGLLSRMPSSA